MPINLNLQVAAPLSPEDEARMMHLVTEAMAGTPAALAEARDFFNAHPELWDQLGNLAGVTRASWIVRIAGPEDGLFAQAVARTVKKMRAELEGATPTRLERLLVDRILCCWLQVQDADTRAAQDRDQTWEEGEYHQRRMASAQRRYLASLRALATVRKLEAAIQREARTTPPAKVADLADFFQPRAG